MKYSSLFLLLFIFLTNGNLWANDKEILELKENYKKQILSPSNSKEYFTIIDKLYDIPKETYFSDQVITDLMQYYPEDPNVIQNMLDNIDENGRWKDIDYEKKNRSRWYPQEHAERIYTLAIQYSKESSPFFCSKKVADAIHRTTAYWLNAKMKSPNWWHNQIGVPKLLGSAWVLFEDELTEDERQRAIEYLSKSVVGKYTGQNKVWLAGINFTEALLSNDLSKAKEARDNIVSEISVSDKEGIKKDHSFQQHGAMMQFANYGAAYIVSTAFWGKVFNKTSLAIDQEKLDILSDLVNEGFSRVVYNGFLDTGVLARQYFHNTQPHKGISLMLNAVYLSEIDQKNKDKYLEFISSNLNSIPEKIGIYHFWESDYTVARTPHWMTTVRMSSERVQGGESLNGDNKQGYYTGDGATFLYNDGDEYLNIFPAWCWKRLPGVTSYNSNEPVGSLERKKYINNSNFVGNVNDGVYGLTSMQLSRDGLEANKLWIFTPDFVIAFGNSIQSDSVSNVSTSVEQSIRKSDLLHWSNKKWVPVDSVLLDQQDVRLFHDKTGYIILDGKTYAIQEKRIGVWNSVMNIYPETVQEEFVVNDIWIDHGTQPRDGSYSYILLPNATKEEVMNFKPKDIKFIKNEKDIQVVNYKKLWFISSTKPLDIKLKNLKVKTNEGGLFIIDENNKKIKVAYADPTQTLDQIDILINNKKQSLNLPTGSYKGTSTLFELKR